MSVPSASLGTADEPAHWGGRHRIISALGVTQILAWGSSYYLLAVLAKPIVESTGWAYGWVVGGLSLALLVSGLLAIRVGRLIDDFGGRPVLAASSVALAAGLVLLAVSPGLPVYLLAWLVMGLGMGAGLYDASFSTLGRLYGRRGRSAITTLTLWGGFASTVCWPMSAFLVDALGWRGACLTYAAVQIVVALPLHLFVVPAETPRRAAPPPPGGPATAPRMDAATRRRLVLLVGAIVTSMGVVSATWSVLLLTILQAQGLTLAAAVALGALVGPSQVSARVLEMLGRERHHPIWTMLASGFFVTTGLVLLWSGFPVPALALVAYGAGNGIFSIARGTLPLALFGPDGYARLMGRIATPSLIAQALAPFVGALLMQTYGAHATLGVMVAIAALNGAGMITLWLSTRHMRRA